MSVYHIKDLDAAHRFIAETWVDGLDTGEMIEWLIHEKPLTAWSDEEIIAWMVEFDHTHSGLEGGFLGEGQKEETEKVLTIREEVDLLKDIVADLTRSAANHSDQTRTLTRMVEALTAEITRTK